MDSSPHLATAKSSQKSKLSDLIEQFFSSDGCHAEKQVPNMDDAVAFRSSLKARIGERREAYKEFIRLISDYQRGSIEFESAITAVKELLGGHSNLIDSFNTFLLRECKITVELRERWDKCISLLNKVKDRFPNDENCIYSSFLRMIMSLSQDWSMPLRQVCEAVPALFSSHLDLVEEFRELLPDAYRKSRCSGGDIAPGAVSPSLAISAKRVKVDGSNHGLKRQHARNEQIRRPAASRRSTMSKRAVMKYSPPLDTSNLEQCTPSYYILPENYRFPVASCMSELDESVLNHTVVLASKRKR